MGGLASLGGGHWEKWRELEDFAMTWSWYSCCCRRNWPPGTFHLCLPKPSVHGTNIPPEPLSPQPSGRAFLFPSRFQRPLQENDCGHKGCCEKHSCCSSRSPSGSCVKPSEIQCFWTWCSREVAGLCPSMISTLVTAWQHGFNGVFILILDRSSCSVINWLLGFCLLSQTPLHPVHTPLLWIMVLFNACWKG